MVLTSGYNEQDAINRFATEGLAGFVHKLFTLAGLADVFRRVLER